MAYWLAVYSPAAWEKTRSRRFDRAAFPAGLEAARRVKVGDRLVCYVQRTRTFAGVLEVTGDLDEKPRRSAAARDVGDPMLPLRLPTRPLVVVSAELGLPAKALEGQFEFVRGGLLKRGRGAVLSRLPVRDARRLEKELATPPVPAAWDVAEAKELIFDYAIRHFPREVLANGGSRSEVTRRRRAPAPARRGRRVAPPSPPERRRRRSRRDADAVDQTVRKTPHLDLPSAPVEPASEFEVAVWVDEEAPREDETVKPIELGRTETLVLQVRLVTSKHFSPRGRAVRALTVRGDRPRSRTLRFALKTATSFDDLGEATIAAYFTHDGDPAGMVRRVVTIAGVAAPREQPRRRVARRELATVVVPVSRKQPDLTVMVDDPHFDLRQLHCTVTTPHLAEYAKGRDDYWSLPMKSGDFVLDRMGDFIDSKTFSPEKRRTALVAAGVEFFNAAPRLFHDAFWRLIDEGKPLRSILVMSEDPNIPWELMVPNRPNDPKLRKPLGVDYALGRWVAEDYVAPPQAVVLRDAYVVAPATDLKLAAAEREYVLSVVKGKAIDPASIEELDRALKEAGASLIHVVTHADSAGDAEGGDDWVNEDAHLVPNQVLVLEDDELLSSYMLLGYEGIREGMVSKRPLVFLNACEIARKVPTLVGASGFADVLISLSASAVIAPVWAVEDDIAFEVAKTFYDKARDSAKTPAAKILARLRGRAYLKTSDFDDSYAAYCFYGDPLATIAVG